MVKGTANKLHKDNSDEFFSCRDNFIKDAWNCDELRQIRKSMITDQPIAGCSVCYLQEESGRTSNRQHANNEWMWRLGKDVASDVVAQASNNDGRVDNDIVYLDLRLGNLCNLKCRMCNPWNSSQIAKEHASLNETNSGYAEVWKKTFGVFPAQVVSDNQKWFDDDIMWDQVISLVPHLKKVYMTGGEPTLIKNNFRFMQECIDQGRTDLLLFFNTNCTNVNSTFTKLLSQFDEVNINVSIDGVGEVNNYIRPPSDWKQISANVGKLAQLKNIHLGVTPTVQVYNICGILDIIRWVEKINIQFDAKIFIDFLINVHPNHMNIDILPVALKQEILAEIHTFIETEMGDHPEMTRNSLNGIIGLLQRPQADDWEEQRRRLIEYTLALDAEREQDYTMLHQRIVNWL